MWLLQLNLLKILTNLLLSYTGNTLDAQQPLGIWSSYRDLCRHNVSFTIASPAGQSPSLFLSVPLFFDAVTEPGRHEERSHWIVGRPSLKIYRNQDTNGINRSLEMKHSYIIPVPQLNRKNVVLHFYKVPSWKQASHPNLWCVLLAKWWWRNS